MRCSLVDAVLSRPSDFVDKEVLQWHLDDKIGPLDFARNRFEKLFGFGQVLHYVAQDYDVEVVVHCEVCGGHVCHPGGDSLRMAAQETDGGAGEIYGHVFAPDGPPAALLDYGTSAAA